MNFCIQYGIFQHFSKSIRVDRSASKTDQKLEPAAAGTQVDSVLLDGFLHDLFNKRVQSESEKKDSELLFSFLESMFGRKAH